MRKENESSGLSIAERFKSPTPKFFKKLRIVGLILAAAGGTIIAAPIALPSIVITVGGYLVVAGSVATAVSQAVVEGPEQ